MLRPIDKSKFYLDDKDPIKYDNAWEQTLWTTYSYKMICPDCDKKRTSPCKCRSTPKH